MITMLSWYWWVLALRGLIALVWPALTLLTLIYLVGAYVARDAAPREK